MAELKDGTLSKQRAEYVDHNLTKRGKTDYIELSYKHLDSETPDEIRKTGAFISQLDQESIELIKAKGTFVVVKIKAGKFWNLTKIEHIDTYVAKSKFTKPNTGYQTKSAAPTSAGYNTAGVKVGAVLHDAVALAGTGASVATVRTIAEELLNLSYELEANVNSGKYTSKTTAEPVDLDKIEY